VSQADQCEDAAVIDFILRNARAYGSLNLIVQAAIVAGIAMVTTALGVGMVVWIPPDHFQPGRVETPAWWRRHPLLRGAGLLVKNTVGVLFVIAGGVMALPLVPGPGLLFILLGFSVLDFPGKRRIERRLLQVPSVLRSLNAIRARFNRPPLLLEPAAAGGERPPS
jgi:hypothetical protein